MSMITENITISAVLPCYKVEKFLKPCVESILRQTFRDFEIILVDDGSPDNTGKIADELAQTDGRIRVIHQPNGGAMKARETGAKAAQGEWISFVDADDALPDDAFEQMIAATQRQDTDIVVGFRSGVKILKTPDGYSLEDFREDIIARDRFHVAPWGRLFRRSMLTDDMFDIHREVVTGEDWLFNIKCAFATQKLPAIIERCIYLYTINAEGLHTNKETPDYLLRYDQLRMEAVPETEHSRYMPAIMKARFIPLLEWTFANLRDISWQDNVYVKYLREDIARRRYRPNLQQRMLLSRNVFLRFIYFNLLRISYHF